MDSKYEGQEIGKIKTYSATARRTIALYDYQWNHAAREYFLALQIGNAVAQLQTRT